MFLKPFVSLTFTVLIHMPQYAVPFLAGPMRSGAGRIRYCCKIIYAPIVFFANYGILAAPTAFWKVITGDTVCLTDAAE